jgi:hypothetical protein
MQGVVARKNKERVATWHQLLKIHEREKKEEEKEELMTSSAFIDGGAKEA